MTIAALIDKQDTVEIVRDQIGAILALEVASQMALAATAAKDANDWKLRVYAERSNPWEEFLNDPADTSPLVNVWWEASAFDPKASTSIERQKSSATYNIDCYGYGKAADNPAGGHTPGDREAAFETHRVVRLVRNILMAAEYTYLALRGVVWGRWPQSITIFQPEQAGAQIPQIVGARLALRVEFSEFSPQVPEETLDLLSVDITRESDGLLLAEADYDYT